MAFEQALCPILQQSLANVAQTNAGYLTRQQTGFLDMLVSPMNRQGFEQIEVASPNGGARRVEITFVRPLSPADVVTSKPDVCGVGTERFTYADLIDPSTMVERYITVATYSEEELAKICFASTDEYRAMIAMGSFNALFSEIDKELLTQQIDLFGNPFNAGAPPYTYVPPVAAIPAPILKASTLEANYPGWVNAVAQNLKKIRVSGRPMVVGNGDPGIYLFTELLEIGCCNDGGIDLSQANQKMAFFYDQQADDVWGANYFGAFAPGALQLISYNEYGGVPGNPRRKRVAGLYEHDTIIDPYTGLAIDFKLRYDDCAEAYNLTMGLKFKLWALPATTGANDTSASTPSMYNTDDPMFGTRGTLLFEATTA